MLRGGVLGYCGADRCEEAEMEAPQIQRSSFLASRGEMGLAEFGNAGHFHDR